MLTCTCCVAGEQVGAATNDNTLEEIQPSRWPPSATSSCTLMKKVKSRFAVGFVTAELVADAAEAPNLALDARRCKGSAQGSTCEPYFRLLPSAWAPARPVT